MSMSSLPGYTLGIRTVDDVFPAQRTRRLSERDIEHLATMDPTTGMNKGALRAFLERSTDPSDPARPLVEALRAVPTRDPSPAPYVNPARVPVGPSGAEDKRPLTAVDIEWLKTLPSDPSKVSAEDVATLARMVQQAANTRDLRFLKTIFEPIWNHHDVAEQQAERRRVRQEAETRKAARNRTIEHLAVQALTAHILSAEPALREYEARNRAAEHLRDRWADVDLELQAKIDAAPIWETPTPRPMPGIEGLSSLAEARERAQRQRERREGEGGLFGGMRIVGG